MNRSLQYGFEGGYRGLLTVGRSPVGILLIEAHPRFVDVNIHPAKREVRFRDERAAREAIRTVVRQRLEQLHDFAPPSSVTPPVTPVMRGERTWAGDTPEGLQERANLPAASSSVSGEAAANPLDAFVEPVQTEFGGAPAPVPAAAHAGFVAPTPVYRPIGHVDNAPLQVFDTYLLVPEEDRILIIDQHALHERLTYDSLVADLKDHDYQAQQLVVPILVELPPSHAKLMEANLPLFSKLGIEMEPFGGTTFQVTAVCHLYDEGKVPDAVFRVLDQLAQGDLFSREDFMADALRLTVEACRGSVKAGDRLSSRERRELLEGFQRMRPPYTCPHGRPIITELTQVQMEKSFRRRQ
jgi:DNA mismatch repair protein MutL